MVIFLTGATSGFGEAMARRFINDGAMVLAIGRREARLHALASECGDRLRPIELDVTDRDAVIRVTSGVLQKFEAIDVLVNNAGLARGLEPAQRTSLDDWDAMVDTNIKGLMYCTHAILPGMVARNKGYIINIGSTAGEWPYPGGNVYGGTKAFVRQFSLNLRADLAGTAVRVSEIEPGLCGGTEFSEVRFHGDADKAAEVYANTEALSADDIAETAAWLLSRPPHVNVNAISLMPVSQSFASLAVSRKLES